MLIGDWTPVAPRPGPSGQPHGPPSVLTATGKLQAVTHQHRFMVQSHVCAHVVFLLNIFVVPTSSAAKHRDAMAFPFSAGRVSVATKSSSEGRRKRRLYANQPVARSCTFRLFNPDVPVSVLALVFSSSCVKDGVEALMESFE